ncbi:hypothetical protein Terro_2962 [Terriglobus roseus DSM 18391]|uniref:Uncharacterized protein n=1 Tax=Terriglobus roseus (strain DSM 18391 / NRRL B-41598 / KBS 63) TaxID=926566 RepID=I3ZIX6_TERRK|nr:hypothetical protein Terro_2962 [Terriglobus roseus DSM 18391]
MDIPQSLYRSLDRLVAFTLSCGAISAVGFALIYSIPRPASKLTFWTEVACVAVLFFGGVVMMFFAASRLRDAVQNGRWSSEAVDEWRSRTSSSWWHVLMGVAFLTMLFGVFASLRHHGSMSGHPFYWPSFVAAQTLLQVSAAFRKPAGSGSFGSPPVWRNWQNFAKLKSDHWGKH